MKRLEWLLYSNILLIFSTFIMGFTTIADPDPSTTVAVELGDSKTFLVNRLSLTGNDEYRWVINPWLTSNYRIELEKGNKFILEVGSEAEWNRLNVGCEVYKTHVEWSCGYPMFIYWCGFVDVREIVDYIEWEIIVT